MSDYQEISVPVNINGVIKVRVPCSAHPGEMERIAIERLNARISQPFHIGEVMDSRAQFEGEVWSDHGNARVGNLEFEVRHDAHSGVSGAMVGLAPQAGAYGATSIRARITAYVSRESVFITARKPQTDDEQMLAAVQIVDGEVTAFLMDPAGEEEGSIQTADIYVRYPDLIHQVN